MHCRNCGADVAVNAEICLKCGVRPDNGTRFCQECGAETRADQEICIKCGVRLVGGISDQKDYLTALLLSIFLGTLGVDRFYTGYTGLGILKLLTAGGCGIWWLIDVIMIATGSYKDANGRSLRKR
ncbi:TM2 domain-containing protein [bacterium]|nr:TM2 domain-containing protein [bacterium]MBU1982886.1 TM2 domain-containing protein [bacterium]